jgi:chromosome partitioning protein
MRKITVINQKGGTGKTTTVVNLGAALAELGREVLLVDLDPQAGLTESLGVATAGKPTVAEVLAREAEPREAFHNLGHLAVLPASPPLAETEKRILRERPSDYPLALSDALSGLRGFDFILVDCPPSLGALSLMGMVYSGSLLIPLQTHYMALNGLEKILGMVRTIREAGFRMEILGILPCMYDVRTSLSRQVEEHLRETLREKVFRTVIRQSVSLAEAPARSMDVLSYRPNGRGAEDYRALAQEVLRHG